MMKVKNKLIQKSILLLSILSLSFGITGCTPNEKRKVRISETGVYVSATSQIMREKKILEKHLPMDVKIEWNTIATGPDARDAILSKNIDIADFSLMTYIIAYENNLPLTLISFAGSTPINIYSKEEKINKLSNFEKDARIAITNKATNLHIAFLGYSKEILGNAMIYDNCLFPIPAADAIASLQMSDEYSGAIFSFPMMAKAEKIDNLKLIADMTEVIQQYSIGDVYIAHSEYAKNNPDIIEALRKAQDEVLAYITQNPEECAIILSELYNVEKDLVLETLQKMPPKKEVIGYNKQAELLYEANILDKEPIKFENISNYENIPK